MSNAVAPLVDKAARKAAARRKTLWPRTYALRQLMILRDKLYNSSRYLQLTEHHITTFFRALDSLDFTKHEALELAVMWEFCAANGTCYRRELQDHFNKVYTERWEND